MARAMAELIRARVESVGLIDQANQACALALTAVENSRRLRAELAARRAATRPGGR
jgi:hypothetical protein